jgi:predicted DCC family thiol-disulfide oxidoreductase YuxK
VNKDRVILFDGYCSFCNANVDMIWKYNSKRNLYYSGQESDFAKSLLKEYGIASSSLSTIYFYDGGKLYERSTAVFRIMKHLDFPFPGLSSILNVVPIFISNAIYRLIASNRYLIAGKKETCRLPGEEERKFFLD